MRQLRTLPISLIKKKKKMSCKGKNDFKNLAILLLNLFWSLKNANRYVYTNKV